MKRRALKKSLALLAFLLVAAGFASVTPVDRTPYTQLDAYHRTTSALDAAAAAVVVAHGPLMAGFGEASLTPNLAGNPDWHTGTFPGLPLAGFSARRGAKAEGVHDPLWVKTIALQEGNARVVLVSLDMLLVPRQVTDIVEARLTALGLDRAGLYLSATHSHSSIGGWGRNWTYELAAGLHRDGTNRWIAGQVIASIEAALADLKSATLATGWVEIPELVKNCTDRTAPAHPGFPLMTFRQTGERAAVFGSYAAHPVILEAGNRLLSGDYPGAWERVMEARGFDMALFMAGPVGGQEIAPPDHTFAAVDQVGTALADHVSAALPALAQDAAPVLAKIGVTVTLPDPQVRFSDGWRLRPWLARLILPLPEKTFVQAVRIGDMLLFSTPCDYAGELALPLERELAGEGLRAAVTSFNGDYIGYVMPTRYDDRPGYETRELAFYGPGMGDFAASVLQREAAALTPAATAKLLTQQSE